MSNTCQDANQLLTYRIKAGSDSLTSREKKAVQTAGSDFYWGNSIGSRMLYLDQVPLLRVS